MFVEAYEYQGQLDVCRSLGVAYEVRERHHTFAPSDKASPRPLRGDAPQALDARSAELVPFAKDGTCCVLVEAPKERLMPPEDFVKVVELLPPVPELGRIWETYERDGSVYLLIEGRLQSMGCLAPVREPVARRVATALLR